jgi:hypothetical protein
MGCFDVGLVRENLAHDVTRRSGVCKLANLIVICTPPLMYVLQIDHPEIKGRANAVAGGGFDAFGGDGTDGHGHGTHCGKEC